MTTDGIRHDHTPGTAHLDSGDPHALLRADPAVRPLRPGPRRHWASGHPRVRGGPPCRAHTHRSSRTPLADLPVRRTRLPLASPAPRLRRPHGPALLPRRQRAPMAAGRHLPHLHGRHPTCGCHHRTSSPLPRRTPPSTTSLAHGPCCGPSRGHRPDRRHLPFHHHQGELRFGRGHPDLRHRHPGHLRRTRLGAVRRTGFRQCYQHHRRHQQRPAVLRHRPTDDHGPEPHLPPGRHRRPGDAARRQLPDGNPGQGGHHRQRRGHPPAGPARSPSPHRPTRAGSAPCPPSW
ncbi:hypothetical protein SHXM_09683 [Streptomyces hygroscopicus]|nr:hypothetical protein SHXM_09683 [Streptomyces hygroscopicus]